jgi:hypothetical protein
MIKKIFTSVFLALTLHVMLYSVPDSVVVDTIDNYQGWGWEVLVVHNNFITLGIIPSIGARVLQYDLGVDTFMIANESLFGEYFYNPSPTPYDGNWGYGGYKTWPAPQSIWNWPPPPTMAWGNYEYEVFQTSPDSVVIWMKGQTETIRAEGLRFDRYITFYRNSTGVKVTTVLFNDNSTPEEWAIWDVTQSIVRHQPESDYQNISVYFPIVSQEDIWYTWGNIPARDEVLPGIEKVNYSGAEGKIFASVPEGWVCFVDERDEQSYAKVFDIVEDAEYPDDGGIVQVYTNGSVRYMEIEVTGPLANIGANGDSIVFTEYWYAGRTAGPIYSVTHAGIIREPLEYSRSSRMVTGGYASFNEGEFKIAFLNEAEEVLSFGPSVTVTPDVFLNYEQEILPPAGTRFIDLQAYNSDDELVGTMDRYDYFADDSFIARKASVSPVIDGVPDDECWDSAVWYPLDFVWLPYNDIIDASDFTGRFKISWTENELLFLVEATDDSLYDGHVNPVQNYWDDDCVELFLDEDHSGGNHLNNYNAFAYHVGTQLDVVDNGLTGPMLFNEHIEAAWEVQDKTYTWELAVKIFDDSYSESGSNAPVTLTHNKEMGFSMAYCDNDGSPSRENFIGSKYLPESQSNNSYIDASIFGTLTLIDPDGPGVDVEPFSDGGELIRIFPNPAHDVLFYNFTIQQEKDFLIIIRNLTGQILYSDLIPSGTQSGTISLGQFECGLYMVEFVGSEQIFTRRLVII